MAAPSDPSTTEAVNPESADLDRMTPLEVANLMNAQDEHVLAAVRGQLPAIAALTTAIAEALRAGGRLFYTGAGTSGRLGVLDASECPPTFGVDPTLVQGVIAGGDVAIRNPVEGAEDDSVQGAADLQARGLTGADCVVGIAASGTTPYVLGGIQLARSLGCVTGAVTCNAGAPLATAVAHPVTVVVGPEVLAGSTRLKAGTATKMVLNMLTTGAMVQLGKTYGNLMVDVQASNDKLRDRARRLLQRLTGLDPDAAAAQLAACDGELKTGVVAFRLGVDPEAARARLAAHGGRLRAALESS